jgi:hypothetical protein
MPNLSARLKSSSIPQSYFLPDPGQVLSMNQKRKDAIDSGPALSFTDPNTGSNVVDLSKSSKTYSQPVGAGDGTGVGLSPTSLALSSGAAAINPILAALIQQQNDRLAIKNTKRQAGYSSLVGGSNANDLGVGGSIYRPKLVGM